METNEFNKRIVASGLSIAAFARHAGKMQKTIKGYTVNGVPKKSEKAIDDLLTDLCRQMHIDEYINNIKDE
jgi:hypothetical protein